MHTHELCIKRQCIRPVFLVEKGLRFPDQVFFCQIGILSLNSSNGREKKEEQD